MSQPPTDDGNPLPPSPKASNAHQDAAQSPTHNTSLPSSPSQANSLRDKAQPLTDNQHHIGNGNPLFPSPQTSSLKDMTPALARSASQSQSQTEATRVLQEGDCKGPRDTETLEEPGIDTSLLLSLIDPPGLPTNRESVSGVHQEPAPAPLPSLGFGKWAGNGSRFGLSATTLGPPPNAPTGPPSTRTGFQKSSLSFRPVSSSPEVPQNVQQHSAKRRFEQLSSRSPSPAHVRIKLQCQPGTSVHSLSQYNNLLPPSCLPCPPTSDIQDKGSPEEDVSRSRNSSKAIDKDTLESEEQRADPANINSEKPSRVFILDPHDKKTGWQILCLTQNLERRRICGYLGFAHTSQMRAWENSNPTRWTYITKLSSAHLAKVSHAAVMRIICNSGGAAAEVAAYIEASEPWTWTPDADEDFTLNRIRAAAVSKTNVNPICTVIRLCSAIIWLIHSSPAQFPPSGRFNTAYFWYAPEDVNRAFWYLSNLRYHPEDRRTELTQSTQPANQLKMGSDAGLASLHNSVVKGEWSGRFLRKDIVARQVDAADDQGDDMRAQLLTKQTNTADNQGEEIRAQLLRLRKWAYKTYPLSTLPDESELDRLINLARRHAKPQNRNMDIYTAACMDVQLFVWTKAHPDVLEERAKDSFC